MQPITKSISPNPTRSNLPATILRFRAGQLIFDEGQNASRWFEVVSGTVRTCRFHLDGHRHLTGFYFRGDVFGAETGQYSTSAEAVTDTTVRCYRVENLANGLDPEPPTSDTISILFRAMSSAQRYQFVMGCRTASERLAAFLLCLQQRMDENSKISLPMSRGDIADFLGLTIHTVSRTFTELSRRGLISIGGRNAIIIRDCAGLYELAGEPAEDIEPNPDSSIHPDAEFCFGDRSAA